MAVMHPIEITYRFRTGDGSVELFQILLDAQTLERLDVPEQTPPSWTALGVHQCAHCPLDLEQHQHCPAALSLLELVERFNRLISYAEVDVEVETAERTVTKRCSAQRALSSLLGLKMATSGCPSMGILKPMARFHQPFASRTETLFRAACAYLLAQYFENNTGNPCDLNLHGLQEIYNELHAINVNMARRLRTIAKGDAHLNAIILLDIFAQELPTAVDDKLQDLEHLFRPYLDAKRPVSEVRASL